MEVLTNGLVVWNIDWLSKVIETEFKRFCYGSDIHGFIKHVELISEQLDGILNLGEV